MYIFRFVSNITNTMTLVEVRYDASEISKCFIISTCLRTSEYFREAVYLFAVNVRLCRLWEISLLQDITGETAGLWCICN